MTKKLITRRGLLTTGAVAAVGGVSYAAYRTLIAPNAIRILEPAEYVTLKAQRLLLSASTVRRRNA